VISYSWQNKYRAYSPSNSWSPWIKAGEFTGSVTANIAYEPVEEGFVLGRVMLRDKAANRRETIEFFRSIMVRTKDTYGDMAIGFQTLGPKGVYVEAEVSLYGPVEQEDQT
jgi:hypothetical protein